MGKRFKHTMRFEDFSLKSVDPRLEHVRATGSLAASVEVLGREDDWYVRVLGYSLEDLQLYVPNATVERWNPDTMRVCLEVCSVCELTADVQGWVLSQVDGWTTVETRLTEAVFEQHGQELQDQARDMVRDGSKLLS